MDDQGLKRLRAAVAAAWWTVLIFGLYLTAAWFAILHFLHTRPDWLLALWGGEPLTWGQMQIIVLWCFAALKLIWWVGIIITVWLTLYTRRLARQG